MVSLVPTEGSFLRVGINYHCQIFKNEHYSTCMEAAVLNSYSKIRAPKETTSWSS